VEILLWLCIHQNVKWAVHTRWSWTYAYPRIPGTTIPRIPLAKPFVCLLGTQLPGSEASIRFRWGNECWCRNYGGKLSANPLYVPAMDVPRARPPPVHSLLWSSMRNEFTYLFAENSCPFPSSPAPFGAFPMADFLFRRKSSSKNPKHTIPFSFNAC